MKIISKRAHSPDTCAERNRYLTSRVCTRDEAVYEEGGPADTFYIVVSGSCKLVGGSVSENNGKFLLSNGNTFGTWTAESDRRSHRAVATSDTLILAALDRKDFTRLCDVSEIQIWIGRFWKLMTTYEPTNDSDLRQLFDDLDKDGGGSLCRAEIRQLLDSLGKRLSTEQMDTLMSALDTDGSGAVDFAEFSGWWWAQKKQAIEQQTTSTRQAAIAGKSTEEGHWAQGVGFDLKTAYSTTPVAYLSIDHISSLPYEPTEIDHKMVLRFSVNTNGPEICSAFSTRVCVL